MTLFLYTAFDDCSYRRLCHRCRLCNNEPGWFTGVCLFTSITRKAVTTSLTSSSILHSMLHLLVFQFTVVKFSLHSVVFRYLNAIQTMCPHILRYLTTAVITNKRRKAVLKDLVKVIQQVHFCRYSSPCLNDDCVIRWQLSCSFSFI